MPARHSAPTLFSRVRAWFHRRPEPEETYSEPEQYSPPWEDTEDAGILRLLTQELHRVTPLRASHWVMGRVWFEDIAQVRLSDGYLMCDWAEPSRHPEAAFTLCGIPVRIHPWANVPTLVPFR